MILTMLLLLMMKMMMMRLTIILIQKGKGGGGVGLKEEAAYVGSIDNEDVNTDDDEEEEEENNIDQKIRRWMKKRIRIRKTIIVPYYIKTDELKTCKAFAKVHYGSLLVVLVSV